MPDYQGIGVGKRLLNFLAELYTFQTKMPFYILTSNPQIIRGDMKNWKISRFGHASKGRDNSRINSEIRSSLSRKRITVSMQYVSCYNVNDKALSKLNNKGVAPKLSAMASRETSNL